jgi:hypothetical protein
MAPKYSKFEPQTPPPGFQDTEVIRLTQNGVWLSNGEPITHEPTIQAFFKSLKRDETSYFLQIAREMKRIEVEDTAYFVERIEGSPEQGYVLQISDGTCEKLDPLTLRYQTGRLTCAIHDGDEIAKFLSGPYLELLQNAEEINSRYFLVIEGKQVEL